MYGREMGAYVGTREAIAVPFHRTQHIFEFGKHKGQHSYEVDEDYLEWVFKIFAPWGNATFDVIRRGESKQPEKKHVYDLITDLKECSKNRDLQKGKRVHRNAVEAGKDSNVFVAAALINMYAKCGNMVHAQQVFGSIEGPDVVSWTALIMGYVFNGEGEAAMESFYRMKITGCTPNSVTYIAAVKACTSLAADKDEAGKGECLKRGRQMHSEIGHNMTRFLQNTLIDMYTKCGSMADAQRVFDSIAKPDVVSWTAVILGYAEYGQGQVALDFFSKMKLAGSCAPDSVIYLAVIKACTSLAEDEAGKAECFKWGREIHSADQFVLNALINMYAKCRSMTDALRVFHSIPTPDVVSWNALILGYAENGESYTALELFSRMKSVRRCAPNSVTYLAALKACTSLALHADDSTKRECLERGRKIHLEIGCHLTQSVQNTLVDMYGNCGSMLHAQRVFDNMKDLNVVSWTSLILGYAENGEGQTALNLFSKMKIEYGCAPDSLTYVAAIKACTSLATDGDKAGKDKCLKRGKEIHSQIGHHMDHFLQSTLINMYAKCGSMVDACRVFDSIEKPNTVSWTALIMGYVDNGENQVALDILSRMRNASCSPDAWTYIAALKAYGSIGALPIGRKLHSEIAYFDVHLVTCLVDFYAKCGSMKEARDVFDSHSGARNITTWNALLTGYGSFGDVTSVFNLFEVMQDQGFRPNAVTFVCILSCCSHAGLVEKAREYLEAMPLQYGVTPNVMHYSCMIDVLGRTNRLDEAVGVLQNMPFIPDAVAWMAVLGACCKWRNVEVGRLAFQSLMDLDEKNETAYVLMAQIYDSWGIFSEQERILKICG